MALPSTKVEIAFDSGYTTPAASRTWTDVSAYVEGGRAITITRGRQNEVSEVQPSTLALTLNNKDGRFTPEKTSGAYYPNVKKGRPIRVTVTYNAVSYTRFMGYINEWPVTWPDSSDGDSLVTITASSRMARLGLGDEIGRPLDADVLADQPFAYYPMDESADLFSTTRACEDRSGNDRESLTIALPTRAGGPILGADPLALNGSTSASWTDAVNARVLDAAFGSANTFNAAECMVLVAPGAIIDPLIIFSFSDYGSDTHPVYMNTSGQIAAGGKTSTNSYNDGEPHHVAIRHSGGTLTLYVDGVSVASGAATPGSDTTGVRVGEGMVGRISNLALYTTAPSEARLQAHAAAALTGFADDTPKARLERYALYAGVPTAEQSFDTGSAVIAPIDSTGLTPLALMQKVASTDNGTLYDAKDGTLTFKGRSARYAAASSATLSAATQELLGDLGAAYDDQFLVNYVTATGVNIPDARDTDSTSTGDYGFYRRTLELATESSDDILSAAHWHVAIGKEPRVRYSPVAVDLTNLSTSQTAATLTLDLGSRFDLAGLPSQAPASTADLFVEGYSEAITHSSHAIAFNTSPTYGYAGTNGVWQLQVDQLDGTHILAY